MPRLTRAILGLLLLITLALPAVARPLTLNDNFRSLEQGGVLLYDLAEDGDRDRALAYIRQAHADFFASMDLIDARRTPRSRWIHRLERGFVLYGAMTAGSVTAEVLAHTYGGLQLAPGRIETPLFHAEGNELRLITVARNPFGRGPVSVYAAEGNALLPGINEAFHGPMSFHLYSRNKTLVAGTFNEAFRPIPGDLSVAEAQADARELFESLERIHPNLLARLTRPRYETLRRSIDAEIGASACEGRVPVRELARVLYRAAAAFQDGHTSLSWYYQPDHTTDPDTRYPSFLLEYRNGRFAIARTLGMPQIEGREVVSIEGTPTLKFLAPILDRCSGELLAFKARRFDSGQTFFWSLTRLLGAREHLSLTLRGPSGRTERHRVPTVPLWAFEQLETDRPERPQDPVLSFPRPEVAAFHYPAFEHSPERIRTVEEVFRTIALRKPRALILDLRGNGGGNSAMSDVLLRHLTRKKVRSYSRIDLKVSPETIERFPEWFEGASASVGQVLVATSSLYPLERTPHLFSGRLYVLTDGGTFSSAADFAAIVKGFGLGTLVGYETGGLAQGFGDVITRHLSRSDLPYGVSCKQFFAPVPAPGDDRHGVRPDVAVSERLLGPYARQRDPLMAFTVELARRAGR